MATQHGGFLIQSSLGSAGSFELLLPSRLGGLMHLWRDNDAAGFPWRPPALLGVGRVTGASLIQSNFGANLEAVVREGDRLAHYWRSDHPPLEWSQPAYFAGGVSGDPSMVQGPFGGMGNFEVVAPLAGGGIGHFYRDNDHPDLPWQGPGVFGAGLGAVDAAALIHSSLNGDLEVVARVGQDLVHLWRQGGAWNGGATFFSGAAGAPAFIQGRFGAAGNFEVVTPLAGGGLAHLGRDNDNPALPWSAPTLFGAGEVDAVAIVQGSMGTPGLGNFEVVARVGPEAVHYWRADQGPPVWHGPTPIVEEPAGDPPADGEWRIEYSSGVVGAHAALLETGRVLFFTYREPWGENSPFGDSSVLDPASGELTRPALDRDPFCGGASFLADGRLLVAGGVQNTTGDESVHTFTPSGSGGSWQYLGDMPEPRWYPTCTTLGDGRVLILSGKDWDDNVVTATYEVFDPGGGLQAPVAAPLIAGAGNYGLYPFVFLLPDGRLLVHTGTTTGFLDVAAGGFVGPTLPAVRQEPRNYGVQGSAVLLPLLPTTNPPYRVRVVVLGGGAVPEGLHAPATDTCELLDLGAAAPAWQPGPTMPHPRVMPDAVLLPDGAVLVVNGSSAGYADNAVDPVYPADVLDPLTGTWSTLASMRLPRLYHSTALLLPDARVITAGTDAEWNPHPFHSSNYRVEVFSPPYLFGGPRPRVTAAPALVAYGQQFPVATPDAASVASACLLRCGAVTHSFNMDQRHVGLVVAGRTASQLTLVSPPNANVAPPGPYMLFLVDAAGVPSVAPIVRLG